MTIAAMLETLEGVSEEVKPFYAEQEGKFHLDIGKYAAAQVDDATKGLRSKVDELLGETKAAKKAREDAEAEAAAKAAEAARKSGDTEALEASWQAKFDKLTDDHSKEVGALRGSVEGLTVGQTATTLAAELAVQGSATVLERIVRDRLSVENTENGPIVRVLDASGKPSASSLDDLKAELIADKALAPIMVGSKARGPGAPGQGGGAGKPNGVSAELSAKVPGFSELPTS